MFEKDGKFYADWRDRTGARKRKSFTTARAALKHETDEKESAHPKGQARNQQSQSYCAPVISLCPTATPSIRQPKHSSQRREAKPPVNSPQRRSLILTKRSTAAPTLSQPKRFARRPRGESSAGSGKITAPKGSTVKSGATSASAHAASRRNGRK